MEELLEQRPSDCLKVVLYGPESTGKTTLSRKLATHYDTLWVPEFARDYLQEKWDSTGKACTPEDMIPIAKGQMRLENEAAAKVDEILVCDTDLLETKVYSEAYYDGMSHPLLEKYALKNSYDIYLLTYIDIPWAPDDLRDRPDRREEMFAYFEQALIDAERPYIIIKGNAEERMKKAVRAIDKLLEKKVKFNKEEIAAIEAHGLTERQVSNQIERFRTGIPFADLWEPATIGNGILKFNAEERDALVSRFEKQKDKLDLLKFTPASGAATRMFKFLYQFLDSYDAQKESINSYINRKDAKDLRLFLVGLERFPFYGEVLEKMGVKPSDIDSEKKDLNELNFIKTMLLPEGLNYGSYPKGLFPFHKYAAHNASAFEEHLFEASHYASSEGKVRLHFTISKEHHEKFRKEYDRIQKIVEEKTGKSFDISVSFQSAATDTIAVNPDNSPYRDGEGNLLFRPGGHGALLTNLNEQDADIIFMKNIDNVVVYKFEEEVAHYKKMLAGKLLELQEKVFSYLSLLDGAEPSTEKLHEIVYFLQDGFAMRLSEEFEKYAVKFQIEYLRKILNRPIRICGMVKNEGEPGGGPFWVRQENGSVSLQIVESVQINPDSKRQQAILKASTHFNPVDVVCGVRDYRGEKFDLTDFSNPNAGFITKKTVEGNPIKALEHPGLWNGAMALWNTIFVEVPLVTFNPVKTVNDLLKPAHIVK